MEITKEQFQEWKDNRVTKEIMSAVKEESDAISLELSHGGTLSESVGQTAQITARAVGKIQGLKALLDIEFTDTVEEEDAESEHLVGDVDV